MLPNIMQPLKFKTYHVKYKGFPTFLWSTGQKTYEEAREFARRMGVKTGFPLISFKVVKRDKRGRFSK